MQLSASQLHFPLTGEWQISHISAQEYIIRSEEMWVVSSYFSFFDSSCGGWNVEQLWGEKKNTKKWGVCHKNGKAKMKTIWRETVKRVESPKDLKLQWQWLKKWARGTHKMCQRLQFKTYDLVNEPAVLYLFIWEYAPFNTVGLTFL